MKPTDIPRHIASHVRWLFGVWIVLLCGWNGYVLAQDAGFPDAVERAKQATVGILSEVDESATEAATGHFSMKGSGFFIGDGYIVTARHAVERPRSGTSNLPDRIRVLTTRLEEVSAHLVGVDRFLDVAVYRLDETGVSLRAVAFADREPIPGEDIFTVGYPLGWGPAMTFGKVGNTMTFLPTAQSRLVQLDLSACSGNSGGGLFDAAGNVIGLVHAIIRTESVQAERRCSRLAFAVPGPLVASMVEELIQGRHPAFPRLGIRMTAVKQGVRWRVAVSGATGPARAAGLRKGDVLLAIDDTEIQSAAQLKSYLLERTKPGQRVRIRILREHEERTVVVVLGGA